MLSQGSDSVLNYVFSLSRLGEFIQLGTHKTSRVLLYSVAEFFACRLTLLGVCARDCVGMPHVLSVRERVAQPAAQAEDKFQAGKKVIWSPHAKSGERNEEGI